MGILQHDKDEDKDTNYHDDDKQNDNYNNDDNIIILWSQSQ